jgi:hypothetical protein
MYVSHSLFQIARDPDVEAAHVDAHGFVEIDNVLQLLHDAVMTSFLSPEA